jgi:hypothetical protein
MECYRLGLQDTIVSCASDTIVSGLKNDSHNRDDVGDVFSQKPFSQTLQRNLREKVYF